MADRIVQEARIVTVPQMVYARHVVCGCELEWRTNLATLTPADGPPWSAMPNDIYCPGCQVFVASADITTRGSLAAYRAEAEGN